MKQALMKVLLVGATALLVCAPGSYGAFPGENGKLAWAIDDTELGDRLICMGIPGGAQTCQYGTTSLIQDDPAWSSDGTRMALMSFWEDGEIAVRNADGSGETLLTGTIDDADGDPAWAPGDTLLAFTRESFAAPEVYAIKPDGSGLVNLTNHPALDVSAAPGSTGRIAFTSNRGGSPDIYLMDPDGGNVQQLTHAPGDDGSPNWSPDGEKIVFISTRDGNSEIYVMDADGGNETRLTETPADIERDPAWSPDGFQIAFLLHRPWWEGGGSVN